MRRPAGHKFHAIPFVLRDPHDGHAGYAETAKIFCQAIDEWYIGKKLGKKITGLRVSSKIGCITFVKEQVDHLERRNVWVKGERIKIKLELAVNRKSGRERSVLIKYGDIEAPEPIVEGKYFPLGTHRKTIKSFIRETLIEIQKKQPRI